MVCAFYMWDKPVISRDQYDLIAEALILVLLQKEEKII